MKYAQPILALGLLLASPLATAEMYKWVDKDGVTRYGDRIPPEYAKQQREVLNKEGQTVKILEHEKTAEELAEDAREAERLRQEEQQAKRDRILLQSYGSEADLNRARDEQLASIDGQIGIAEMALENVSKDLQTRRQREAELKQQGKPVPPDLQRQLQELNARAVSDQKALEARKKERAAIAARFERNIVKWRELRGITKPAGDASAPDQGANTNVGK